MEALFRILDFNTVTRTETLLHWKTFKINIPKPFIILRIFFDTEDQPYVLDDDFTPKGFKKWNESKFKKKVKKIAKAISRIGLEETGKPPALVGVAEVENKKVIRKLLRAKALRELPYDFVHFDSPDERGIDTALIYNSTYFEVIKAETLPLLITDDDGDRDFTRDILYVHGRLNEEEIHLFVNHWPSRRAGTEETSYKRLKAAETVMERVNQIDGDSPNVVIMGDFNDDPNSESIMSLMATGQFINPMQKLLSPSSGSANYKGKWSLFDQIVITHTFLNHEKGTHSFEYAKIFVPKFLQEWKGKYKGNPFRTFVGRKYLGGYSDHFPVFVVFELN